ncbi:hypothetical protein ABK040_011386 [Willaertia magna]
MKSRSTTSIVLLLACFLAFALLLCNCQEESTTTTIPITDDLATTASSIKNVNNEVNQPNEFDEEEKTTVTAHLEDYSDTLANTSSGNTTSSENDKPSSSGSGGKKRKVATKKTVQIQVPSSFEKFRLKPKVIGEKQNIKFYNAQNTTFYQRKLKNPILTLWILIVGRNVKGQSYYTYSAKRFFETAWKRNIQVELKEIQKFDLIVSQEGLGQIIYDGKPIESLPDAVLPRLGAHIDYWGLAVIRQFEKMDVLVLNGIDSLEMTRDKLQTLQQLAKEQIPIPKTILARFPIDTEILKKNFEFPIILKKSSGSQGKGVILIQNEEQIKGLGDMLDVSKSMIFQEYISASKGRDIRVIVVGGRAVGAMMRIAKTGFKSNFHQGGWVKPVRLSRSLEWLAITAAQQVELDFAGVDILIDNDTYKICEINSSPGFEGFEMATGVGVPEEVLDYVKLRTSVWRKIASQKNRDKLKKNPILIPVQAEHVVAAKPANDVKVDVDLNGNQVQN